jgi:murein DD-endopeptidase MepM/ murein hydrolase activator NlpD
MGETPLPVRRRVAEVFGSATVATVTRTARSVRRAAVAVTGLALVAAAGYGASTDAPPEQGALASIEVDEVEIVAGAVNTVQEEVPPVPDLSAQYKIPSAKGTPLDELYPSLAGWIHPVIATELQLSVAPTGLYGAERNGVMRRECGRGHCGVDLSGPIGRPIVAVGAGVVVHIDRSRDGRDGRSGRYVRIEHPDGVLTSYMHLNGIRRGIEVGTRVAAGDQVGTLGNSGIHAASPHLHFALELPRVPGTHGDHVNTRYIDPAPFLVRATITETVDRRHPAKPAF